MIFLVQFGIKTFQRLQAYGLVQFFVVFEKFFRAYLFQIALEIIWLPIQIKCVFIDVFFFVAVYKFFEQRNVRLRGNPDFAPGIKFVFIFVKSIFFLSLVVSMVVKFMSVLQECILYKLKVIPPLSCCILIHKNVTLSLPLVYM